jgi:hypothetical protein
MIMTPGARQGAAPDLAVGGWSPAAGKRSVKRRGKHYTFRALARVTKRRQVSRLNTSIVHILILACLLASASHAAAAPPVETLMTPEDFSASGLGKLSEAERAHLSEWLARYREGVSEGPAPKKTTEQRAEEKEIEIVAKVVPAFTGWGGSTVFRLDNGQVWQQRQDGKLRYQGDDSTVVISQNFLGGYMLRHPATNRGVGVKRIE